MSNRSAIGAVAIALATALMVTSGAAQPTDLAKYPDLRAPGRASSLPGCAASHRSTRPSRGGPGSRRR